jgi:hypothetical protein
MVVPGIESLAYGLSKCFSRAPGVAEKAFEIIVDPRIAPRKPFLALGAQSLSFGAQSGSRRKIRIK